MRAETRQWIEENTLPGLKELADWGSLPVSGGNRENIHLAAAKHAIYKEWERRLLEARLVCPKWPEEVGCRGWNDLQMAIFAQECARAGVPRVIRGVGENLAGAAILVHGTPDQRRYFLPRIVSGQDIYCQGYSEPDHGSDLGGVETRGVIDGQDIVIHGQKTWTSRAQQANMMFIVCRTNVDAPKHLGLSYVLAEFTKENGVTVQPILQMSGASVLCQVFLDGVRAPLDNIIGGLNNGWQTAMTTLTFERGSRAVTGHVSYERQFWDLVEMTRSAGRDRDPLVRQQLAWAYTQISIMRYAGLRLLAQLADGRAAGPEASISKLFWSEYHKIFGEIALDISGPAGMIRPSGDGYPTTDWQDIFLASRAGTIYAGTSEIQKNVLGERVLGLPRERAGS